jgi:hypothetical protein
VPLDQGHLYYHATLEGGSKHRKFRLAIAFQRPGRLRMEVLGPVGGARAVIASDGQWLRAALPPRRVHARASASPGSLGILLGLPLSTDDLLEVLTGSVPAQDGGGAPEARTMVLKDGGHVRLEVWSGLGPGPRRARVTVTGADGSEAAYLAEYRSAGNSPWGPLAGEIVLSHGARTLTLRLKTAIRALPAAGAFQLAAPSRFQEVSLEELSGLGTVLFADEETP